MYILRRKGQRRNEMLEPGLVFNEVQSLNTGLSLIKIGINTSRMRHYPGSTRTCEKEISLNHLLKQRKDNLIFKGINKSNCMEMQFKEGSRFHPKLTGLGNIGHMVLDVESGKIQE